MNNEDEIKCNDYCLTPISRNRYKINVFAFKFYKNHAKKIYRCYYSGNQKCWVMPRTSLNSFLNLINLVKNGKANAKSKFKRNQNKNKVKIVVEKSKLPIINPIPSKYKELLTQKKYSAPTIKTYCYHFQRFLNYYIKIPAKNISIEQIRRYILYLVQEKKYSESGQNSSINAIKFYYEQVLNMQIDEYFLPRPRRAKTNPKILSVNDVLKIFKCISSIREKCMIFLIYSTGLTPSEVTYIKLKDVNTKKMKIFISSAKGIKDRHVILSEKLLNFLRDYYEKHKPKYWLFENKEGKQFSKRKIQKVFQKAVKDSGVIKKANLTILKNSFAVHLLEKGVDIRYLQKLFGHKNVKTTSKYLKVTKRDIIMIKSPLDDLDF